MEAGNLNLNGVIIPAPKDQVAHGPSAELVAVYILHIFPCTGQRSPSVAVFRLGVGMLSVIRAIPGAKSP